MLPSLLVILLQFVSVMSFVILCCLLILCLTVILCICPKNNIAQLSSSCNYVDFDSPTEVWHRKLGHPSISVLILVLKNVKPALVSKGLSFCSACKYGKMYQMHYSLSSNHASKPFQIVHSDLWGPSPTMSTDGYRYYVHFIDEFTRYTWMYPFKNKVWKFFLFSVNFKL